MLHFNLWDILFTIINILILYAIFRKFLFGRVMDVIHKRDAMIKDQFDQAQKSTEEADAMKESYQKKLSEADEEANRILADAKTKAEEERARKLEETQKEAQRYFDRENAKIAAAQKKAEDDAKEQIANLAVLAAQKILESGGADDAGNS